MIDSHCHLFDLAFINDVYETIDRAKEVNVKKILLVGFSNSTNIASLELAKKYPSYLYPTCGVHPSEITANYLEDILNLEKIIKNNKVYAIGECGLDYHYDTLYKEEQKKALEEQIKLSIKYDLPLVIHSRDAISDTYNILKKYPKAYGVMHCYSGSKEMALEFLKLGFYISLGGPVTFKNARVPKEAAEVVPLDKLLIETDSPYLAPTPFRGKRNEPSYLPYILKEISEIKKIEIDKLEEQLENNTIKLFRLE